ncbi:MAG: hypothetical protein P9M15_01695 [Candidatus Electryoneaceae bacterium]|nr:hypothetical protein [Candidatus Electryoneaceae bacterium]
MPAEIDPVKFGQLMQGVSNLTKSVDGLTSQLKEDRENEIERRELLNRRLDEGSRKFAFHWLYLRVGLFWLLGLTSIVIGEKLGWFKVLSSLVKGAF